MQYNNFEAKKVGVGIGLLSFFIPPVGIGLFFAWRKDVTKLGVANRTLMPALVSLVYSTVMLYLTFK